MDTLFVFSWSTLDKMQGHFWHMFLIQFFMLFHMVACILFSMVALLTAYFKDSYWLLKKINQSKNGWKSYHGEQNQGYHEKEHKKLIQKLVSKMTLHFVWSHLSKKQTVFCVIGVLWFLERIEILSVSPVIKHTTVVTMITILPSSLLFKR